MEFKEEMFGKPDERIKRVEKYDFAVLTMCKFEGKGTSRKFVFNKAATELLGLDTDNTATVGFVFQEGQVYLANTTGTNASGYGVTKGMPKSFSDSKVYSFLAKNWGIEDTLNREDVELKLTQLNEATFNNYPVLQVTILSNEVADEELEGKTSVEDIISEEDELVVEDKVSPSPFHETEVIE